MNAITGNGIGGALVFAPQGRDASVAAGLLADAGITPTICRTIEELAAALADDIYFAVVTEDALRSADLRSLVGWVAGQATWSDFPFLVLTQRGGGPEHNPGAARLAELLGNVIFLERPFHPTTFLSVARTALKGRQRQYDARARIEELFEGEERLRTALVAGHLGSWELDLNNWTLKTSPECKALYGCAVGDALSYDQLVAAVHADDRARMKQAIQHSLKTGEDYAIEYRTVWRDKSVHWAEIRARLVRDRLYHDHAVRLVGVCSDITDRKTTEDHLRHLNETLEERVRQRTAELEHAHRTVLGEIEQRERAEQQLRQAQKMETIGQITGGVAHDFNNLLMAVIANLDLLRKHVPDDAKMRRLIEGAMQGARRGATLTQRLLAFARRQELHVEPKSLVEVVRGMSELLERSVGSQVELTLELPDRVPPF